MATATPSQTIGSQSQRWLIIGVTVVGIIVMTLALMELSYGNGQISDNSLRPAVVIHLISVIPALPLGAYVLIRRKGDRMHKLLGRIWAGLMLISAISTFWFGLSFIHIFTALVLVSLPLSIWNVRRGNIRAHRQAMEGMYIGLVVAGTFAFIPGRLLGSLFFG